MDTVRKRIRDDLVRTLEQQTSAEHVSVLADEPVERRHALPAILVHPVADEPGGQGAAISFEARRATFALEAWLREPEGFTAADPALALADAVEAFLGEVIRAVCMDPTRGGAAISTRVGAAAFLLLTSEQRLGGFELEVVAEYRYSYGQPGQG